MEGIGWIAQIGLFVMLGLLAFPDRVTPRAALIAVTAGLFLTLVARPATVVACAVWFKIPLLHQVFLSWAGLRGAVPIVLATIPLAEAVPGAEAVFDVVLVFVIVFTCVQGPTLPFVARRLGLVDDATAQDVEVEVAPLDKISADLLQVRSDGAVRPWFTALLEADGGLPDLVDGWTVHPYPSPRAAGPGADGDARYSVKRVAEVRAVAERERAVHPIWITEIGWTTATESEEGVSEEEQARYLEETLALAEGPWRDFVARTFVYTWSRSTGAAGDVEGNYGLRRADGSVKPAWRVVREHASDGED